MDIHTKRGHIEFTKGGSSPRGDRSQYYMENVAVMGTSYRLSMLRAAVLVGCLASGKLVIDWYLTSN